MRARTLVNIVNLVLFDDFESLDLFGPVEIFGKLDDFEFRYLSRAGGVVRSGQGAQIMTRPFGDLAPGEILLVPGGQGTRDLTVNEFFLQDIRRLAIVSRWVLAVCTGSALLAKAGLLDGKRATSNKRVLDWVMEQGPAVLWDDSARWVRDGVFWTSSGVSAGMDMSLAFIAGQIDFALAASIARRIEYRWENEQHNGVAP